jgi:phospholipid transport system substrate-binding protein
MSCCAFSKASVDLSLRIRLFVQYAIARRFREMMNRLFASCTLMACLFLLAASLMAPAQAAEDPAVAHIRSYYDALLDAMKHAKALGVSGRYEKLAPVVRDTFDLPAMTRIAVGPPWTSIPADQQSALVDNFTRMTIATYASRFDGYSGERFEVDPKTETRGRNRIVRTRLIESNGNTTTLNYLMHETGSSWKVIDVYLSGTVSELPTRGWDYSEIHKRGGGGALIESLRQRTAKLLQ